jgi:hypothetical protein
VHHHDEELVGDWLDEMEQSSLAVDPSPAADEVVREAVDLQCVQVIVSEMDEALQVLSIDDVLAAAGILEAWPPLPISST